MVAFERLCNRMAKLDNSKSCVLLKMDKPMPMDTCVRYMYMSVMIPLLYYSQRLRKLLKLWVPLLRSDVETKVIGESMGVHVDDAIKV